MYSSGSIILNGPVIIHMRHVWANNVHKMHIHPSVSLILYLILLCFCGRISLCNSS